VPPPFYQERFIEFVYEWVIDQQCEEERHTFITRTTSELSVID
jgi:hypothetical protein